jgi:hypothetical protein
MIRQVNDDSDKTTYSAPATICILEYLHLLQLVLQVGQLVVNLLLARLAFLCRICISVVAHQEEQPCLQHCLGSFAEPL